MCVNDLERSMRFYCDGLGFEPVQRLHIDETFGPTLEVPAGDVAVSAQYIRRDELTIELLCFRAPAARGTPSSSRSMLGITHLAFQVDDFEHVVARLEASGGTVLHETMTTFTNPAGDGRVVFVADPDGVRVEIAWLSDREAIMASLEEA
jgi:catechol 2,3-dioxygenase-like lactoylglutathione lyase family enzyme